MKQDLFVKGSGNVFKGVGFNEVEAKNLKFRSHLMSMLISYIKYQNLTQKEAAQLFGIRQPRVSNLMQGKIDLFSIDKLFDMLELAGFFIYKKMTIHFCVDLSAQKVVKVGRVR